VELDKSTAGLIIPLAALSIPVIAILSPVLSQLVTLFYILGTIAGVTLAARYLMELRHSQRLEELDRKIELENVQSQRLAEAERLIQLDDEVEARERLAA